MITFWRAGLGRGDYSTSKNKHISKRVSTILAIRKNESRLSIKKSPCNIIYDNTYYRYTRWLYIYDTTIILLLHSAVTVCPLMTNVVCNDVSYKDLKTCDFLVRAPRKNNFRIYGTNSPPFTTKQKSTLSPRPQNLNAHLHSKMSNVLKHRTRPARMSDNSINLERKREQKTRIGNKKNYGLCVSLLFTRFLSLPLSLIQSHHVFSNQLSNKLL